MHLITIQQEPSIVKKETAMMTKYTLAFLSSFLINSSSALYTGKSSWLGFTSASPTPDYQPHLPLIYIILGINGTPHVRAIVEYNDDCPSPLHKEDVGYNLQEIDVRSLGNPINDNEMPYRFPVKVCELKAENGTIERNLLERGLLSINFKNKTYPIQKVNLNPSRFLFLSDTVKYTLICLTFIGTC